MYRIFPSPWGSSLRSHPSHPLLKVATAWLLSLYRTWPILELGLNERMYLPFFSTFACEVFAVSCEHIMFDSCIWLLVDSWVVPRQGLWIYPSKDTLVHAFGILCAMHLCWIHIQEWICWTSGPKWVLIFSCNWCNEAGFTWSVQIYFHMTGIWE